MFVPSSQKHMRVAQIAIQEIEKISIAKDNQPCYAYRGGSDTPESFTSCCKDFLVKSLASMVNCTIPPILELLPPNSTLTQCANKTEALKTSGPNVIKLFSSVFYKCS